MVYRCGLSILIYRKVIIALKSCPVPFPIMFAPLSWNSCRTQLSVICFRCVCVYAHQISNWEICSAISESYTYVIRCFLWTELGSWFAENSNLHGFDVGARSNFVKLGGGVSQGLLNSPQSKPIVSLIFALIGETISTLSLARLGHGWAHVSPINSRRSRNNDARATPININEPARARARARVPSHFLILLV